MVRNKRGWLRIMEATIAIMILAGVLITIYSLNHQSYDVSESIYVIQEEFLDDIENSYEHRTDVLENETEILQELADGYFPSYLDCSVIICNLTGEVEPCKLNETIYLSVRDKNLYVSQTVIATNVESYSPKILKIYSWEV